MSDQTPLLVQFPDSVARDVSISWKHRYHKARRATRKFLTSRVKHWLILTLIILDIAGILSDIFIALITCELDRKDEGWIEPTRGGLTTFSLVLSCLFMVELLMSLWAEGLEYFSNWFHCFDAFVIVGSFVIDLLEHGIAEEIASLIVILRLWRFVKIVNEFSVEASEQMEDLHMRVEKLEKENGDLRAQLGQPKHVDEEAPVGTS